MGMRTAHESKVINHSIVRFEEQTQQTVTLTPAGKRTACNCKGDVKERVFRPTALEEQHRIVLPKEVERDV